MTATMIAARMLGDETIDLVECPRPDPGAGEIRVRIEGCGVCASNLPLWQGRPWFEYPRQPGEGGHEAWGTVDACGPGVRLEPGRRVTFLSERAYGEFDVTSADCVVELPQDWGDRPAPGEPLGCAVNVFARSDVRPGQHVAIVGVGFLGALLVQLVAAAGAVPIAISRDPAAREHALRTGAQHALGFDDGIDSIVETVQELTAGRGCERVLEVTGKQVPLDLAGKLAAVRGRLVIAGYHQDGTRTIDMQSWNWRGLDVVNAHERDARIRTDGMREAVRLVAAGRLDPAGLYTVRLPLPLLSHGLAAAAERPVGFFKTLVAVGR